MPTTADRPWRPTPEATTPAPSSAPPSLTPGDDIPRALREATKRAWRNLGGPGVSGPFRVLDSFELAPAEGRDRVVVLVLEQEAMRRSLGVDELVEHFRLTRREAEVALALEQRLSSREIARAFGISHHTARRHVEHVLRKMGIRSRRDVRGVLAAVRGRPWARLVAPTDMNVGNRADPAPVPPAFID